MKIAVRIVAILQAFLLLSLVGAAQAQTQALPPLSAYGELPQIEDAAISDSGKSIAFLALVKGKRTLLVLDDKLKPHTSFVVGDAKVRSIRFIGDEAVLMVNSTTESLGRHFVLDKLEVYRALVLPLARDLEPFYLFSNTRDIENGIFGDYGIRLTSDGWIGYFGGLKLERPSKNGSLDLMASVKTAHRRRPISEALNSRGIPKGITISSMAALLCSKLT